MRVIADVGIEVWLAFDMKWFRITVSLEAMEYLDHNNDTVIINQRGGEMVLLMTVSRLRCRGRCRRICFLASSVHAKVC
jgi:hypothetical protein